MGDAAVARAGQERRLVTVVFADVTGSTGLGERLDPERLQEVMASYFSSMREAIEAEGGTVEKFIGDAVMAAFGVPIVHEDDPARALRAALRMRERLAEVNRSLEATHGVALQMRIGVNTGEVLAAVTPSPGEPMVTGDTVNVAARLEQSADPGQILVSERTARAARTFRFREVAQVELRGKDRPVPAVVLESEQPESPNRGVPGIRAPMVGRDVELALLETIYERVAAEGRPNLITIYGDPGVGKSRLTAEFLTRAAAWLPPPLVVRGRCLPYGEGVTYWPLAEILKGLTDVRDTDSSDVALEKIRRLGRELLTPELASNPEKATASLAFTVGVEDPAVSFHGLEPREVRRKTHDAWRSFFSALAARTPVVAVIEDIHWADPALLDLLQDLAERVVGPALFVCPARPELTERRPDWGGGRRNFSSLAIEPLSEEQSGRLVSLLLSIEDLPQSVHGRILERAEGNPFFLEEIVRQLIDEGRIVRVGDRWRAAADIEDVVIPDTVQAVLAARIDLLAQEEKLTLQGAAVVGRVFWPGPVLRLLNGQGAVLDETLARLEERELVLSRLASSIAGEPEFMFKHVLTREVAYESLPRRDRAAAHIAVAAWIEETAGERAREFVELLAYHYEEAYRTGLDDPRSDAPRVAALRDKAFRALLDASEEARRRFAVQKAARLADRALALAPSPIQQATALEQIGLIALNDYRGDLAWQSLREAVDLRAEHSLGDRLAIARVCARAVEVPTRWPGSMRRQPAEEEVRRYLDLGLANVGEAETEELIRLLTAKAFGPFSIRMREVSPQEIEEADAAGRRAAEIANRMERPDLASAALDGAGSAAISSGNYGPVVSLVEQRMELVPSIEDPWELGDIFAMGAWGWAFVGDYPRALRFAEEGALRAGTEAEGLAIHNLAWVAFVEFQMGNWDRVVNELFPRCEAILADRAEDPPYFTGHLFGATALILDARNDPAAERRVALVERLSQTESDPSAIFGGWLAWILARRGKIDEALIWLDRLDRMPWKVVRPFVDQVRADVLASGARWHEATGFAERTRAYAADAGLVALPAHMDRLEGRAALAASDMDRAVQLLSEASERFERLGARWERACTDLSLAEALISTGGTEGASGTLARALGVFQEIGSLLEIGRSRELLAK